jgi:hypothetical protein
MKMRSSWTALAVAALLWAGTATAGTVYLPFAANKAIGGKTYRTNMWITNTGFQAQEVTLRFIPADTPGVEGGSTATITVGPRQTFKALVGEVGQVGMVEATGGDDIVYSARLDSFSSGGLTQSRANLPLIGAKAVYAAEEMVHLQGGERTKAGSSTHLGIATFGAEAGQCVIKVFRSVGGQVQSTATVVAPELGQRYFEDVFDILGEESIADARFEVSCDVPFFPYLVLLGSTPDSTQFGMPAAIGADSLTLAAPGPKAGELARHNGEFFHPVQGASSMEIPLPIAAGVVYDSITFEFDVWVFDLPGPAGGTNFTGTVIFMRPSKGGTFLAHTIRANGLGKSILDLGNHQVARGESGVWQERAQHHVKATLDQANRRLTWEVSRNGSRLETVTANMDARQIVHSGEGLKLLLGLPKVYDEGAYLPPWGSVFSNLVVSGVPRPQQ